MGLYFSHKQLVAEVASLPSDEPSVFYHYVLYRLSTINPKLNHLSPYRYGHDYDKRRAIYFERLLDFLVRLYNASHGDTPALGTEDVRVAIGRMSIADLAALKKMESMQEGK